MGGSRWQNSLETLPGGDLVDRGMADLGQSVESPEVLLVSIGAERLTSLGLTVPPAISSPELRLYTTTFE